MSTRDIVPSVPHPASLLPNQKLPDSHDPFPESEEDFQNDTRVHYDRPSSTWVLEEEDREYEWNATFKKWVEAADQALLDKQSATYKIEGVDENEPAVPSKKRKTEDEVANENKKQKKASAINTSIYVTDLPLDVTKDEIHEYFKKHGMITKSIDTGEPRIRMYGDDQGNFKGEALVTYFKAPSVEMAIYLSDGVDIRTGGAGPMRIREADMSYKKHKELTAEQIDIGRRRSKKASAREREAALAMNNAMNARLADWDDDDPQTLESDIKPKSKWNNYVMVKNMFKIEEVQGDKEQIEEIESVIREEAEEKDWGVIQRILVFDLEPDGLVQIRFTNPENAEKAKKIMNGRSFDFKTLEAWVMQTKQRYKMTHFRKDGDEEEEDRLEKYGRDIAAEGAEQNGGQKAAE